MYFIAFLLTLGSDQTEMYHSCPAPHVLCTMLKRFLSQQQGPHDFIRVAIFSRDGAKTTFRITIGESRGEGQASNVLETILSLTSVLLDQKTYEIESVDLTTSLWTGISTWSDIMQEKKSSLMHFSFLTPLLTATSTRDQCSKAVPFPELVPLFFHVTQLWNSMHGPELSQDIEQLVQRSECVVSHYNVHTVSLEVEDGFHTGYLGWIEYESRVRESEAVLLLNALARFASFTGLGDLTEYGMGATAVTLFY